MLKVKTHIRVVSDTELSLMWDLVIMEYPNESYQKYAELISQIFEVKVSTGDLVGLDAVSREIEDRMLIYKHCVEDGNFDQY